MKKRFLLFAGVIIAFASVYAQVKPNNDRVQKAPVLNISGVDRITLLALAKEKEWPITMNGADGSTASLVGIFPDGSPKYYTTYNNVDAAATTGANQLWSGGSSGLNLSGSSTNMKNKLGVWDGGSVFGKHAELTGRITQKDPSPSAISDHTTHVTGTLIASGLNTSVKGMAYGLQGIVAYDYINDINEMYAEAANIILSNHSYGTVCGWYNSSGNWYYYGRNGDTEDYKFGYYDTETQFLDSVARLRPFYLIVKAAGNNRNQTGPAVGGTYYYRVTDTSSFISGVRPAGISSNNGYDILPTSAVAKNILTIGAASGIPTGYTKKEDLVMSTFSSWGPTDDGRIKPDLVADGVNVTSCTFIDTTNTTSTGSKSGTSMATPNATGSLFLLQEYYSQKKAGAFMRSATLKGLAIHTTEEAGDNQGPDYKFGWGLLNVKKAADVITEYALTNNVSGKHRIYENTLANGASFSTTITSAYTGTLTATICWTDPVASVETNKALQLNNATKKLINDLDIRITGNNTTYFPWILDPTVPAAAATKGDNVRDNIERINIDNVVAGETYTITITHKGNLAGSSQPYSLIVSNLEVIALPVTLTSFTAQLQSNSKVLLNWATANEVNNKNFDIEKLVSSNNSATWQKIGSVAGAGNSSILNQYSFTDNDVKQGTTIQYRLKQTDFDGQSKFSNIVSVQVNVNLVLGVNAYPNPVATIAKISYAIPQKGRSTLAVYTLSGKLVTTLFDGEKHAGAYNEDYNTSKLAAGSYVLKLTANGSSVNTIINKL